MAINCETRTGELIIEGLSMNTGAWCAYDLTKLWGASVEVRGTDRVIPGAAGALANPRRLTVTQHSLPFVIGGEEDHLGNPHYDPWIGLETNLQYLRDTIIDPPGIGDGTRLAILVMPSSTIRTADIHVLDIRDARAVAGTDVFTGQEGALLHGTLEISIPAGRFV